MPSHYENDRSRSNRGYEGDHREPPRRHSQGRPDYDYDDDYRRGGQSQAAGRDRDEYGRFTEGGGRYSEGGGRHSEGGGRHSEDGGRYSEGNRYAGERDHGGWYGDSRGHAEAARRGWDNSNHGPSGWYGDSEGHSEASRRGWQNSSHEGSGWHGDSEGHSRAASQRGGGQGRYQEDDRYDRYERGSLSGRGRGRYD